MLRRQFLAAAAAVGMAFSVSAFAAPVEGQDYVVLEKPIVNADKTLIKVYSYDCPFCYRYDKGVVPILKEKLGKELTLRTITFTPKVNMAIKAMTFSLCFGLRTKPLAAIRQMKALCTKKPNLLSIRLTTIRKNAGMPVKTLS